MDSRKGLSMLLPFLLVTFAAANEAESACKTCVRVDADCYNITHVADFHARFRETVVITQLGVLRNRNILYYAFEPNITDPEYYKVGYVSLEDLTKQGTLFGAVSPVTNFRTFAIDQEDRKIYLGGGDGIYISNNGENATAFSSIGDTIQNIFFKKNLFFVRHGEYEIVEKIGEEFVHHEEFRNVRNFVIDRNNIVIFMNTTGLHARKVEANETVHLSKNGYFRGLVVNDLDGVVYAWWIDGLYRVVIGTVFKDSKIVKIAEIPSIGAVTFDNDSRLLFSSEGKLYMLEMTTALEC